MKWMMLITMVAYVAANVYINLRLLQPFNNLALWVKIIISVLFWVVALSLFLSFALRNSSIPEAVVAPMYIVGSSWMVFTLYMTLALLGVDLLRLFGLELKWGALYALGITLLTLLAGYLNYLNPKLIEIDIRSDKPISEELKIVALSDVHLGYGTGRGKLRRYIELINRQRADVVIIAGDLIDNSLKPVNRQCLDKLLSEIYAPRGVFMAVGNHEYISGIEECEEFIRRSNITPLRDSCVMLNGGFVIVGRDDRSNRHRKELSELLSECGDSLFSIVVDHQPYQLAKSNELGVDLQLSGHTHHGQVWPLSLLTNYLYEQSYGYRKWSHSHIFVSSGLSLWGPPFRIGTHSDLAIIRITPPCD